MIQLIIQKQLFNSLNLLYLMRAAIKSIIKRKHLNNQQFVQRKNRQQL